jgi:hypothetical protein
MGLQGRPSMKRRLPVVVLVVAVLVAGLLLVHYLTPDAPVTTHIHGPLVPVPDPAPAAIAASPQEAVASYLEALDDGDFQLAHAYLSAASRDAHPYDEFAALCEAGEATSYDVGAVRELSEENGLVVVMVPIVEDPAEASFTTVQEEGGWKVIFIGGAPWFPYSE